MPALDYQTAGESHIPALVTIISGLPAHLNLDMALINGELERRQGGGTGVARSRKSSETRRSSSRA